MTSAWTRRWPVAAVFAGVFCVYLASPIHIQSDSIWSIPTAASLLHRGDVNLDEYRPRVEAMGHYAVVEARGHLYSFYPLVSYVVAAAPLAVMDAVEPVLELFSDGHPKLQKRLRRWKENVRGAGDVDLPFYGQIEQAIASLYTAAAVAFLFAAARRRSGTRVALGVALVAAFATPLWSTASRVLWQHGLSALLLSIVLWLLTLERRDRVWAGWLGVVVALAYTARPTNSLTVLFVTGWVLWRQRRLVVPYLAGAAVIALPFLGSSLAFYGTLFPPYFLPGRTTLSASLFFEALAGDLISPSRGLLVFCPFVALSVYGLWLQRRRLAVTDSLSGAIVVGHWLALAVAASVHAWWGGHSYGPRLFTDVMPYLAWLLVPVAERLRAAGTPVRVAAAALVLTSVAIHFRGATSSAVHAWNVEPINVDAQPSRVWDWSDPQFLR